MYQWPPGRLLLEHCTTGRRRRHCRWSRPSSHHLVSLSSWGCAAITSDCRNTCIIYMYISLLLGCGVVTFDPGKWREGWRRHLNVPRVGRWWKSLTSCVYVELHVHVTATIVESREKRRRLSCSLEFPVAMATRCFICPAVPVTGGLAGLLEFLH